ncbi:MAG: glycosyltransferase [Acidimicrobiales bacterium]|nr:glycosyltransferase [Acidimicrobiales bacterium]
MRGGRWIGVAVTGATAIGALRLLQTRKASHRRVRSQLDRRRMRPTPPGDYRLSVVIPAYREQRIGETVERLRSELEKVAEDGGLEILVVDDGSGDGTAERAEAAGADQVIRFSSNRGKGAAVRAGMLAARGRAIAFTDADLSYSPDQILGLLEQIESGWDVVVGSRRHTDTTTLVRARRLREIGGRVINLFTYAVLLGHHRDTQCGLKAFRSDVARLIFSRSRIDGFAFDVEVFHLVEEYGLSLAEVPVRVQNTTSSTVRVVRDALRLLRDLFRIRRWSRLGVYRLEPGQIDRLLTT